MPFGPNDVFKRLATVLAANILIYNFKINHSNSYTKLLKFFINLIKIIVIMKITLWASKPLTLFFFPYSLKIR